MESNSKILTEIHSCSILKEIKENERNGKMVNSLMGIVLFFPPPCLGKRLLLLSL